MAGTSQIAVTGVPTTAGAGGLSICPSLRRRAVANAVQGLYR